MLSDSNLPLASPGRTWACSGRCCEKVSDNGRRELSCLPSRTNTSPYCLKGVLIAGLLSQRSFGPHAPLGETVMRRSEPLEFIARLHTGVLLVPVNTFVPVTTSAHDIRLLADHHCGRVTRHFAYAARDDVIHRWLRVLTRSSLRLPSHFLGKAPAVYSASVYTWRQPLYGDRQVRNYLKLLGLSSA